ncbi:MAG TPA: TetR/AcrR family transcriptional regulator [Ktedonobacterales bacterium]|nr:TetR/AcrR family transcriptional regulator [Ktedonobacterales bacterium]
MTKRAEAAATTRERILAAAAAIFWERPLVDISLEVVARRAGVSLPTVIRHFGDKGGVFAAAVEREYERVRGQRDEAPAGDARAAVRILVDHYEELGEAVLRLLAEESHAPGLREIADLGRAYHAAWCERVFAPALACLAGEARARRLAEFIAITDVLMWKLLRRDRGLSRAQTELALRELVESLMGET